jgi:hypothetical protein
VSEVAAEDEAAESSHEAAGHQEHQGVTNTLPSIVVGVLQLQVSFLYKIRVNTRVVEYRISKSYATPIASGDRVSAPWQPTSREVRKRVAGDPTCYKKRTILWETGTCTVKRLLPICLASSLELLLLSCRTAAST